MRQPGGQSAGATRTVDDDDLVAAFRAGLTIDEIVAIYWADPADVRELIAGISRPKPRRLLGVAR